MFSIVNCYYDNTTNVLSECIYYCGTNCKFSAFLFTLAILFCCYCGCYRIYKQGLIKRKRMFYIGDEYEQIEEDINGPEELIVIGRNIEKPPAYS
jgi:hypothetical protein